MIAGVIELSLKGTSLSTRSRCSRRRCETPEHEPRCGPERPIDSASGIPAFGRATIGHEGADKVVRPDVTFHTDHGEVRLRSAKRIVGYDVQRPHTLRAHPPRQTQPAQHWHLPLRSDADAAAEEQQIGRRPEEAPLPEIEDSRVLQEKIPLLGKEETESREVHLFVVGLYLCEVGIERGIEHESGPDLVLCVESHIELPVGIEPSEAVPCLRRAAQYIRFEFQVHACARQIVEPLQVSCTAHAVKPLVVPRPGPPQHVLVLTADAAEHVETPHGGSGVRRISQRAERNREFRRPTVGRSLCGYTPHAAPVDVHLAALIRDQRIELGAVGIRGEDHRVTMVVECVEQDRDAVVGGEVEPPKARSPHHPVPLQDPGNYGIGIRIVCRYPHVERRFVVDNPDLGPLRRRCALIGFLLAKSGGNRCGLPNRLVEETVELYAIGGGHVARHCRRQRRPVLCPYLVCVDRRQEKRAYDQGDPAPREEEWVGHHVGSSWTTKVVTALSRFNPLVEQRHTPRPE